MTEGLPESLPIFPLAGAFLLPDGQLPLRIFEPRYKAMLQDAIGGTQLIGMIKPRSSEENAPLYSMGCAGRIISCERSAQGSFIILLHGVARFKVAEELPLHEHGYRCIRPAWVSEQGREAKINRVRLFPVLKKYLGLSCPDCDWETVEKSDDTQLLTCLSMLAPLSPAEQQQLLELDAAQARADMLINLIELAAHTPCGAAN